MNKSKVALFLSLLLILTAAPSALAQFGGLGKKVKDVSEVAEAFSIDDEREVAIGAEAHPYLVAQMGGLSQDKKLNAYVTRVGQRLAEDRERKNITYRFFVVRTDMVNAFALPGGYVYVTEGLLRLLEDEAELAAVLGHELAHVEKRHGVKRMRQAVLAEKGADYAGEAAGSGVGEQVARLVADLFADMAVSGYGRKQELQSDEIGLALANGSGYDPEGAVRSFQRFLELEGGAKKSGMADFFASHPPTGKRIKQAEAQIAKLGKRGEETNQAQYDKATAQLD